MSLLKKLLLWKKLIFNTPEDIARFTSVIAGGKLAGLYWVDGVVFLYFPLPASTAVVAKELLEKRQSLLDLCRLRTDAKICADY